MIIANLTWDNDEDRKIDNLLAEFRISRSLDKTVMRYNLKFRMTILSCNQNIMEGRNEPA